MEEEVEKLESVGAQEQAAIILSVSEEESARKRVGKEWRLVQRAADTVLFTALALRLQGQEIFNQKTFLD